jgi:Uma2 family endonuclease
MSGSYRVKPARPGVTLTYDDFVHFPDDGMRHELIDGEHYVTPSPNITHQQILGNLYWLLRSYVERHPIGRVFMAPLDVLFSLSDVVAPDLLYISNERAPELLSEKNITGSPDLVIEIASNSTRKRDETIKRHLYESAAVREYWLVYPDREVIRLYRKGGDVFQRPLEFGGDAGDVLVTDLLPGLELALADVFKP